MLLRVLGSVGLEGAAGPIDLGGRRQRSVLALLALARGEVVSVDRFTDQLWGDEAPPKAVASLQAYVSNLRRLLEPARAPRTPAKLLVTAVPGYALRLPDEAVDAWRFERSLTEARSAEPAAARRLLRGALDLWRGDAYAEFAAEPWAQAEAARLEELRLAAREQLVSVTLSSGDIASAVAEGEALIAQAPLREEAWRLLALALWRGGRQGDALAAIRRARGVLADQLGLDPGPELRELETAILRQHVIPPARSGPHQRAAVPDPFVGRRAELAALAGVAAEATADGPRIALVAGEAGAGKTTLLAHARASLTEEGWLVVMGRCPSTEGAPPAWAWVEALRELAEAVPPTETSALGPLLDDGAGALAETGDGAAAGRFRLHRAVVAWLREAARVRPVAVVLDDLHEADDETLRLLAGVAELTEAPVLLVAAFRPAAALSETLAALARRTPLRVQLGGLSADDVGRLIGTVTRDPVSSETVAALALRTGGNPFYVRESARLLAAEGALVALSEVPAGVRDVLRRRLAHLPDSALAALRLAAVAGPEAEVEVLAGAFDGDLLNALEAGLDAGLLTEPAAGRVRFVHDLVRDTVYSDVPSLRRARLHAELATSIAALHPGDHAALAHHYARAASSPTARLAVDHAIRAAGTAERRYAYDTAITLLNTAVELAATDDVRVDALGRLLRAQARAGASIASRETRARAIDVAVAADRDDLLIAAFTAWNVPTPWQIRAYGTVDRRVVDLLTRLLHRDDLAPLDRCRLLAALTAEVDGEPDPRATAAGLEALELARTFDDVETYALGLTARLRTMPWNSAAEDRRDLALTLHGLAVAHGLVSYRWFAEAMLSYTAALMGRPDEVRAVIARQSDMARDYHLREAQAINLGSLGGLAHVAGDLVAAQRFYDESAALMRAHGNLHADLQHFITTASVLISRGELAGHLEATRDFRARTGPVLDDLLALNLAAAGRWEEARAVPLGACPVRPDYLESGVLTIRAMAVVALGRADLAAPVIEALLPFQDQIGGFASVLVALRPVALCLAELSELLDRHDDAARFYAKAAEVAELWGSPHWRGR
ncbi:BTAD domain-containing putative transcriptional regulator [Actinoplanes solisilvae]|uniref:BTAD domain-containing putative transcriptional regulator n=1 Tax=Actinoplanes solisilvae TaxID=2486853 RepID=UPI000FDA5E39|nr:BTAD domain-containing putative transcriptional regulator [Actinoplanes solisilvae]